MLTEDHCACAQLQQPERTEQASGGMEEPAAAARRRPPAPAPPPLFPLLFLLTLSLSSSVAAAASGAPVGEDYVRPPARTRGGQRKALLALFPWSKKKASSSASDPQQVTSLVLPNFLPVALDLVYSNGIGDVFGVEEMSVS